MPASVKFLDRITEFFNTYSDLSESRGAVNAAPVPQEAIDFLSSHSRVQRSLLKGATIGGGWIEERSPRYDSIKVVAIDMKMPQGLSPKEFQGDTRIWMYSNTKKEKSCTTS